MKSISKVVLGTMKLKKYFTNSNDLSNFLNYAYKKGIKQFHVSNEYSSYNMLIKSFKTINEKKFTFILKLSEPKTDKSQFNLKRFEQKIYKYREDLGEKHTYIVQLVNRYKCNNPEKYLPYEQKVLETIQKTIIKLKKVNIIKSFYFFPYYINKNKIKKRPFVNGITIYRNLDEKYNDHYAKKNNFKIIAMRTFGGDRKILTNTNMKKLVMFNLKNKLVKKIIIGANNKIQLDQLLKIC